MPNSRTSSMQRLHAIKRTPLHHNAPATQGRDFARVSQGHRSIDPRDSDRSTDATVDEKGCDTPGFDADATGPDSRLLSVGFDRIDTRNRCRSFDRSSCRSSAPISPQVFRYAADRRDSFSPRSMDRGYTSIRQIVARIKIASSRRRCFSFSAPNKRLISNFLNTHPMLHSAIVSLRHRNFAWISVAIFGVGVSKQGLA